MQASSSTKVSSPQEVGWLFVPQYYTFVNKDPSRLHCFYTKRSTFVHGTEGEEVSPRYGQQEIHEKILALGFEDCKVYVSNVDSQSSADGGIIVQVLGEMSNRGGEWRKFAQTFFLAEQPNGYFVLNDIFRYIKEEIDDRDDLPAPASPAVPENLPAVMQPVNDSFGSAPARPESSSLDQSSAQAAPQSDTSMGFDLEGARRTPQVVQHQVNGWHHHADPPAAAVEERIPTPPVAEAAPVSEPSRPVEQAETQHTSLPEPVMPSISHEAAPSATTSSAVSTVDSAEPAPQPAAEAPVTAPAPVKKTWASLAASSGAWKSGAPAVPRGISANVSAPAPSAQAPKPPTASTSTAAAAAAAAATAPAAQQPPSMSPSGRPIPNVNNLTHANCFVKNVQEQVTDEGLRRTLEEAFGPIKELDIVRSKACAFLEFKTVESAKKAIHFCSPHSNGGNGGIECDGMFIHIEEKKPKGDATRLSGQPRGGGRTGAGASGPARGGAVSGLPPTRSSMGAGARPAGQSTAANTTKQKPK